MGILIDENTSVLVQGFTGKNGTLHSQQAIEYGTKIIGGVTPNKGGTLHLGLPVFNYVTDATANIKIDATVIYVPAPYVLDSVIESIDAGIKLIVIITEGVPVLDMIKIKAYSKINDVIIIGPNCPGIITPGKAKIGIMPGYIHKEGIVGIISRSGTLTYEAVAQTTEIGFGQSTCVGIGGDPVHGVSFIEVLELMEKDPQTKIILMIGEIGGHAEEDAAVFIKNNITKPVIGYIAGTTAPSGKRMGHAGAIISGGKGTAEDKYRAFEDAGIVYTRSPADIGKTVILCKQ